MKVWVISVWTYHTDGYEVVKVVNSLKKAVEFQNKRPHDMYEVEEFEVE